MKLTIEQKEANKLAKKQAKALAKETARIESEKNQKAVKSIKINIEWNRSRTWGNCPRAEAAVSYADGTFERKEGYYASGCGYDKESTVIAQIFNDFLKGKLWRKTIEQCKREDYAWRENGGAPYGISAGKYDSDSCGQSIEYRSFSGGIGVNCYTAISEFLGGHFNHIASGKTFDVYEYVE